MKQLLFILCTFLTLVSISFAADVIDLKKGVIFPHKKHQEILNDCKKCHKENPGIIEGFGKDWSHTNCKKCHTEMGKGPTRCKDCHNVAGTNKTQETEGLKAKEVQQAQLIKANLESLINKAALDYKCEEASKLDMQLPPSDRFFNFVSCKDKRKAFDLIIKGKEPKKMYIAAGKYEANGDKARAKQVYTAIMDRFPEHDLAIKATDKLTALSADSGENNTGSVSVVEAKACGWTEGETVKEDGKYLFGDSCSIFGTVELVNKACNKVKISVTKVTNAFGMRIDATCRYSLGQAAERDLVWMNVNPK